MKAPDRNPLPPFATPMLVAAVQLELFARMIFMGRRKKVRYLGRTIFQQTTSRRR
jgi:hypothetical protein